MLGHSRWDSYVWTQQIGQLRYNTVDRMLHQDTVNRQLRYDTADGTIILGHSRWMGHSSQDNYVMTQQMGQLYQDTVDGWDTAVRIITLGHRKWDNCITTQQIGQLYQDTVDRAVTLGQSRSSIMLGHINLLVRCLSFIVAKGEIISRRPELVHGHVLLENEKYILIRDVFEDLTHPIYGYCVEIHSLVVWPVEDLNYCVHI